jgi:hypothetical protein
MQKLSGGQALLVILLVMSVVLTVVLSVASKSITEIKISSTEGDSLRAFNAAEAGVEEALLKSAVGTYNNSGIPLTGGGGYEANASEDTPSAGQFTYPNDLESGGVATFWLVSHTNDGQLTCGTGIVCFNSETVDFCWGDSTANPKPAIEVLFFYDPAFDAVSTSHDYNDVRIKRFVYDPDNNRITTTVNGFTYAPGVSGTNCPSTFAYNARIQVSSDIQAGCVGSVDDGCPLLVKVRTYYNDEKQKVGIAVGGATLPAQGIQISSSGSSGDSNRNLSVFQSYGVPPSIFDSAIYSPGDLIHD